MGALFDRILTLNFVERNISRNDPWEKSDSRAGLSYSSRH